jgi:hypothetical protein
MFNSETDSGYPGSLIHVFTGDLRQSATRLQGIQQKIDMVDHRLRALMRLSEMEDLLSYAIVNLHIGFDYDLKRCIDYLNFAVERLEWCECEVIRLSQEI